MTAGTFTTDEVAALLGFSRWTTYDAGRPGGTGIELPDGTTVKPIRCGRSVRWPALPIRAALGLDRADAATSPTPRPALAIAQPDAESGGQHAP